jgi:imidazolonepropionase-like amidohydrolase
MITTSFASRSKRTTIASFLSALFLLPLVGQLPTATSAQTQTATTAIESGKFRLHKFAQAIGEESYEVTRDGDGLVMKTNFLFTDRGSPVPLTTTLRTRQDLTPEAYAIKGRTSRLSEIDTTIDIKGRTAAIREGKETREAAVPEQFFAISGYAPVSVQMMMVRYWASHHIKGALKTLPGGDVTIEARGKDTITVDGKSIALQRYSLSGVIWGRESLWLDASNQLVAAVTCDAEFDHFEAIKEGYESALPVFITKAAEDGMAALAALANRLSPARKGALVITNATLIDGTGAAPVADAVVVVEGDRITFAGPRAQVKIPKGATVVDAKGKYVLPGLWDMHAHFEQVEWGPIYLAAGVTTVRDVGNEFDFIKSVRDAIKSGHGLGPRLLLAGIVDGNSKMALGIIRADNADEARAVVNRYKDAGFDQIKIYSSVKPDVVQGVEAGMDQINHIQYIPSIMLPKDRKPGVPAIVNLESEEAKQALAFLKAHGTVIDPTIALMEIITHSSDVPVSTFEPGIAKVARELAGPLNNTGVPPAAAQRMHDVFEQWMNILGALHRAGIPIIAGTDQAVPGHSLHREIELYVKAGFTPMEAIQAATLVPARVMKLDKETGSIEVGKRADLIIVDGNPLESISNIRNVRQVVTGGRIYDTATLWQSVGFKP